VERAKCAECGGESVRQDCDWRGVTTGVGFERILLGENQSIEISLTTVVSVRCSRMERLGGWVLCDSMDKIWSTRSTTPGVSTKQVSRPRVLRVVVDQTSHRDATLKYGGLGIMSRS
jgi:hypothetical protein